MLCYQYGGESESGLEAPGSPANWRCTALEKFSQVKLLEDAWRTAPNHSRPASCVVDADIDAEDQPASRSTEGTVRQLPEQLAGDGQSATWRSIGDYAVRGGRGDPRGRKSGGGSGADNPTWPARAEGEKRFRSLTRNP